MWCNIVIECVFFTDNQNRRESQYDDGGSVCACMHDNDFSTCFSEVFCELVYFACVCSVIGRLGKSVLSMRHPLVAAITLWAQATWPNYIDSESMKLAFDLIQNMASDVSLGSTIATERLITGRNGNVVLQDPTDLAKFPETGTVSNIRT